MAKTQARKRKAEAHGDAGVTMCFSFPKPFHKFSLAKIYKKIFLVRLPYLKNSLNSAPTGPTRATASWITSGLCPSHLPPG